MDLGPSWMWVCIFILALVGFVLTAALALAGVMWLFRHVTFI